MSVESDAASLVYTWYSDTHSSAGCALHGSSNKHKQNKQMLRPGILVHKEQRSIPFQFAAVKQDSVAPSRWVRFSTLRGVTDDDSHAFVRVKGCADARANITFTEC